MAFGGGGFHSGGEEASVALNLTALMDILSNLLFFLLASYSAQSIEVSQNLKLPTSSSQAKMTESLTITVTKRDIEVAGVPVAELESNKLKGAVDDGQKIVPLYDKLRSVKQSRQAAGTEAGTAESEMVLLMADRETDSEIITKILKSAGAAGFVNVRFGVTSQ